MLGILMGVRQERKTLVRECPLVEVLARLVLVKPTELLATWQAGLFTTMRFSADPFVLPGFTSMRYLFLFMERLTLRRTGPLLALVKIRSMPRSLSVTHSLPRPVCGRVSVRRSASCGGSGGVAWLCFVGVVQPTSARRDPGVRAREEKFVGGTRKYSDLITFICSGVPSLGGEKRPLLRGFRCRSGVAGLELGRLGTRIRTRVVLLDRL